MNSTKTSILKASLKIFTVKGYKSATTLEISKEAGVSEMSLFRYFKTKKNLFLTTIKNVIDESLEKTTNVDKSLDYNTFITLILNDKLILISKNIKVIKMLIRESLSDSLPEDLRFMNLIHKELLKEVTSFFNAKKITKEPQVITNMIIGLLLRYAILEEDIVYYKLNNIEQTKYLNKYTKLMNI